MTSSWNVPEREITPEAALPSRRRLLHGAVLGGTAFAGGLTLWKWLDQGSSDEVLATGRVRDAGDKNYPALLNDHFADLDRPLTAETEAGRYCNFYEFSSRKEVYRFIQPFRPIPWTLRVDGLVARPRTFDLDDLLRLFPLEERRYRLRCVEAWAMALPWTGFPLAELLRRVEPLPEARFVRFVSFERPAEAPRQRSRHFPWPYCEGLTLKEAGNELTFLATGMYGHPLLKQNGAPLRLVVPWKYGYKSAKSIVRIELTRERPSTFWNILVPREYGFVSNVNPNVPHPRWSQKSERMLGTGEVRPTKLYNGYAEWVAELYHG